MVVATLMRMTLSTTGLRKTLVGAFLATGFVAHSQAQAPSILPSTTPATQATAGLREPRPIYFDKDGLIVHKKNLPGCDTVEKVECQDGGDTAQREGWYWLGVWIRANTPGLSPWPHGRERTFDQVLALLEPKRDGVFYRHPKLPPWNNPHDLEHGFSRDQMEPLVAAMGVWGKHDALRRLWSAMPTDLLGKHTFNGKWINALQQDGMNCSDIERRGCDAIGDCSLKVDKRECSTKVDDRQCGSSRPCDFPPARDTRGCGDLDFLCKAARDAQNALYDLEAAGKKADCERIKLSEKNSCELAKGTANATYQAESELCLAARLAQNALYASEKLACEAGKSGKKAACEAQKAGDLGACRVANFFNGDLIGPVTDLLIRRSLNEMPSPLVLASGDAELLVNSRIRKNPPVTKEQPDPKDNVGDDLNHLVKLLIARRVFPTDIGKEAVSVYRGREHSYGSFFASYLSIFGDDLTNFDQRMKIGMKSGWPPDPGVSASLGAVRWYHRASETGNPLLAELYAPIIERLLN